VQRELPGALVVQVGYLGKRGLRLMRAYDINQIDADPILPSFLGSEQESVEGAGFGRDRLNSQFADRQRIH